MNFSKKIYAYDNFCRYHILSLYRFKLTTHYDDQGRKNGTNSKLEGGKGENDSRGTGTFQRYGGSRILILQMKTRMSKNDKQEMIGMVESEYTGLTPDQEEHARAHGFPVLTLEDVRKIMKARQERMAQMSPEELEHYKDMVEAESSFFK